jgi:uncharacterized coiled-coil protein SlyX
MTPNAVLTIVFGVLGLCAIPAWIWLRGQRRIHDLEMTLLTQSTDLVRYEELKALIQQLAQRTEDIADQQARLADRLVERQSLPAPRPEPPRVVTPH